MERFTWAVNSLKLQRAIQEVEAAEKARSALPKYVALSEDEKEAKIREVYIRLAGLIIAAEVPGEPERVAVANVRGTGKTTIRRPRK